MIAQEQLSAAAFAYGSLVLRQFSRLLEGFLQRTMEVDGC